MQAQGTAKNGLTATFAGNNTKGYMYSIAVDNDGVTPSSGFVSASNGKTYKDEGNSSAMRYYDFTLSITPTGSITISGDTETRPKTYTIRIWKRTT